LGKERKLRNLGTLRDFIGWFLPNQAFFKIFHILLAHFGFQGLVKKANLKGLAIGLKTILGKIWRLKVVSDELMRAVWMPGYY